MTDADDQTMTDSVTVASDETVDAPRGLTTGRRLKLGAALALGAVMLGSATALAYRSAAPDQTSLAAEAASAAPSGGGSSAVPSRNVDQVNRSQNRASLNDRAQAADRARTAASTVERATLLRAAEKQQAAKVSAALKAKQAADAKAKQAADAKAKAAKAKAKATKAAPKAQTKKVEKASHPTSLSTIIGTRYTTSAVNVRKAPSATSASLVVLGEGRSIKVTDTYSGDFRQVSWNGSAAWVSKQYLTKTKPAPSTSTSSSKSTSTTTKKSTSTTSTRSTTSTSSSYSGSCSKSMPSGVTSAARAAAAEACSRFPAIRSFGGYRAGDWGAHGSGQAVDIMISGSAGWDVARWARANASRLGITEVIYSQQIWTTQRAGDGWRSMSDRGSATANHYDHVHITVRG